MKSNKPQKLQRLIRQTSCTALSAGLLFSLMPPTLIQAADQVQTARQNEVQSVGLDALRAFSDPSVLYPLPGRTDLALGKTMIVSSEHNANLVWSKATDGKNYTSGSGTDTNRWAPRGYGPKDLLEGYGDARQGTGDTHRWEFAAVDLGEITDVEDLVLYHSEMASAYRVWLWDGENPVNPDGTPFTGEINGSYTSSLTISSNTATARYKNSYFHQFLPENFRISQEQIDAGKTFENAGFTLVRDFSTEPPASVITNKADRIHLDAPIQARYVIFEQLGTHNNKGTFGGSLRGVAVYGPDTSETALEITSPASSEGKLADLNADASLNLSGVWSGALDPSTAILEITTSGEDFLSGQTKTMTVQANDLILSEDGTWSAVLPPLNLYGTLKLDAALKDEQEHEAVSCLNALVYRGRPNLARMNGAQAISVGSHANYPATRLNDGVFAPADNSTRWSVGGNVDGASAKNVWVGIDLKEDTEFDRIIVSEWSSRTTGFVVEVAADTDMAESPDENRTLSDEGWTVIASGTTVGASKVIDFPHSVSARYVRLRTTSCSSAQPGFTQFEVYKADNPAIDCDALGAPVLPDTDEGTVGLPLAQDASVSIYGSDNQQIVGKDGSFHRPLVDMNVNLMYEAVSQKSGKSHISSRDTKFTVPGKHADKGVNPAPAVVPALREWYGSENGGNFELTDSAGLVLSAGSEKAGSMLKDYFSDLLDFEISEKEQASAGDIEMILNESLFDELGEEGYYLTISDHITIEAPTSQGLLYGAVSLSQIFYSSDDHRTAPFGEARDYPKYDVRMAGIDVARIYYPLDHLEEVGKYMAWFKLNTLHVHLNDYWGSAKFASFRLESDRYPLVDHNGVTGNEGGKNEGYYTKDEYRQFQKDLRELGVEVINEIDTPAHSMIFSRLSEEEGRPPILSEGNMDVTSGENRQIVEDFVLDLVDEYTSGDDPVFINRTVHFGGDEYSGSSDSLTQYNMDMIRKLRDRGLNVQLWSSNATLNKNVDKELIEDENVQINLWHPQELASQGGVAAAYSAGYNIINTSNFLYIDPANYNGYPDRYGGIYYQDSQNPSDYTFEHIYDVFNVNNTYSPRRGSQGSAIMPLAHPLSKGAQVMMWNDIAPFNGGLSQFDLFDRFKEGLLMVSEKTWYGEQTEGQTWQTFEERCQIHEDHAALTNPSRSVESKTEKIADYQFDSANLLKDDSKNGYTAAVTGETEADPSGLHLPTGSSLSLPFDSVGFPYTVHLKARLKDLPENTVLFTGKDGTLYANFNGTGHLGYVRGEYGIEYHFEYKTLTTSVVGTETKPVTLKEPILEEVPENLISEDEWFDLVLTTRETYPVHSNPNSQFRGVPSWTDVALYINGEKVVSRATNTWINNGKSFINSGGVGQRKNTEYDSTSFVLPVENILPDSDALISRLEIYNRPLEVEEIRTLYEDNLLVEFHSNGGSPVQSLHPKANTPLEAPADPTREGYAFAGWFTDEALEDPFVFGEDTIQSDTVLYAAWTPVSTVNKTLLESAIAYAESLGEADLENVNEIVLNHFHATLQNAKEVLADSEADQDQVNSAWKELCYAIQMLSMKSDKTELALLVAQCEALDLSLYEEDEALETFRTALEEAKAVLDNPAALNETSIEPVRAALQAALEGLHERKPEVYDLQILTLMVQTASEAREKLDQYVIQGQSEFLSALEQAEAVLENPQSQAEIDQAASVLNQAWMNLRLKADESLLEQLREGVKVLKSIRRSLYSTAELNLIDQTVNQLETALAGHDEKKEEIVYDQALALKRNLEETVLLVAEKEKSKSAEELVEKLQQETKLPEKTSASVKKSVSTAAESRAGFMAATGALALSLFAFLRSRKNGKED